MENHINSIEIHKKHFEKLLSIVDKPNYEPHIFHDYFRQLPFLTLKKHFNLSNQNVLVASCGTGIDIHYLLKHYNNITCYASDLTEAAVDLARNTFNIDGSVQDNEKLTFPDNSFDYCFIAASLHHLLRPNKGLYELIRVARKGVIVIEPNDSWLSRLFTKLNFINEYETDCKNYVFRYGKNDVIKIAKSLFYNYKIIRMFSTHIVAKNRISFLFLKIINKIANTFFPQWGNYIIFSITK